MRKFVFSLTFLALLLFGFSVYELIKFNDGKMHFVFCNVGQGDGIFIRSPNGTDIVLDSGPDDSILNCLSSHMPFWDRSVELAILTHPHEDHMRGFIPILRNYKVLNFLTEDLANNTSTYTRLFQEIQSSGLKIKSLQRGDKIRLSDGLGISVVGPSREFLEKTSPAGKIGESKEFGSLELLFSLGSFGALTTGDSQIEELTEALPMLSKVDVFQIPHHGSKYGMSLEFLYAISPQFAVISVGKNKYGLPTPEVLRILEEQKVKYLRTDQHGDIEVIVDKNGKFSIH